MKTILDEPVIWNEEDTIPMVLNKEGVYVMNRTARVNSHSKDNSSSGPVNFFRKFDEISNHIKNIKREYYTQ
jgi:hypothetical protein